MEKAKWIKCTGEAHSNPYIDNCMICMPFWEFYPVCPVCEKRLTNKGYCRNCKKHFDITQQLNSVEHAKKLADDLFK